MKVALVHYAVAPVIGGVEQIVGAHARLFAKAGHEVETIAHRGDATFRLPAGASAAQLRDALRPLLAQMDVVFVHNVMTMPFDLPLSAALRELAEDLTRIRFVAWIHDIAAANPDFEGIPDLLRQAAPRFEYVAVSAHRAQQWLAISGAEARVIPNGVEPAHVLGLSQSVAAFAEKHDLLDGRTVLLHPTRLLRRKNVELGLAVMAAWGPGATLLVTGAEDPHNPASRDYAAWLRVECERLDLGRSVVFVGEEMAVSARELAELYQLADALFLPSRQEGFGLPLLEAALHRLPVFVSDIEPLISIGGAHAHRFPLDQPAAALARWIRETLRCDPAFLARKRVMAEFGWPGIYGRELAPLLTPSA